MNTELLAYSLCDYLRDNYPNELCTRYKLDTVEGLKGYEVLEKIGKNVALLFRAVKLIWSVPQIWYLTNCAVQKSVT